MDTPLNIFIEGRWPHRPVAEACDPPNYYRKVLVDGVREPPLHAPKTTRLKRGHKPPLVHIWTNLVFSIFIYGLPPAEGIDTHTWLALDSLRKGGGAQAEQAEQTEGEYNMKKLIIASMALAIGVSGAFANAYTWGDYEIVEADPFASGGAAGNTTAVGGGFFSASGQSATTMRDRTIGAFVTGYESIAGATDRVFDNTVAGPEMVTTVSGLTAGQYDVYAVYLYRGDGVAQIASLRANLGGAIADAGTVLLDETTISDVMSYLDVDWGVGLGLVGTTAAGATGFTVNIDDNEAAAAGSNRIDYIGVAYQAIPEPATLSMVAMFGGAILFIRRRTRN